MAVKKTKKKRGRPSKAELAARKSKEVQDEEPAPAETEQNLTNRVVTCLWKGENLPSYSQNVYGPGYVDLLWRGIQRWVPRYALTVLCDEHYGNEMADDPRFKQVRLVPFQHENVGGWSQRLEMCRPNLRPVGSHRHLLLDLDTMLVGNCNWLFQWNKSPVGLPRDPFRPHVPCSGVWTVNNEGAAFIWDAYQACKGDGMKDYLLGGRPSEMKLLQFLFRSEKWQFLEHLPRRLLSYKAHVLRGADPCKQNASIVYFHGRPLPHELPDNNKLKQDWLR